MTEQNSGLSLRTPDDYAQHALGYAQALEDALTVVMRIITNGDKNHAAYAALSDTLAATARGMPDVPMKTIQSHKFHLEQMASRYAID